MNSSDARNETEKIMQF